MKHSERTGSGCYAKPTPDNCGFFRPTDILDSFSDEPRTCFFYEDKGKDPGFDRWRVCFYYESHMAITRLFATKEAKDGFLAQLEKEAA